MPDQKLVLISSEYSTSVQAAMKYPEIRMYFYLLFPSEKKILVFILK